jgi:uncharacterized protein YlaI
MCKSGKVKHSKLGAQITLKKLKNKGMNIYQCRDCGGWHLGRSNQDWRRQQRIDQLLGKH